MKVRAGSAQGLRFLRATDDSIAKSERISILVHVQRKAAELTLKAATADFGYSFPTHSSVGELNMTLQGTQIKRPFPFASVHSRCSLTEKIQIFLQSLASLARASGRRRTW